LNAGSRFAASADGVISVRGARQHNLKNLDIDIPRGRLTVITGVSGSGKSSLAFDTLYAEGQRRYVESVSTYAKQFLDRMERPDLDSVTGLAPAVAIQQANQVKSARSTVGTATEIYDYLRLLFARVGTTYCLDCGEPVTADSPATLCAEAVKFWNAGEEVSVLAPVGLPPRLPWSAVAEGLVANGFLRVWLENGQQELDPLPDLPTATDEVLVVIDRLKWSASQVTRLAEAFQTAFGRGEGRLVIAREGRLEPRSEQWVCPQDGRTYPRPEPILFSFNSPYGVCPECRGFGDVLEFDETLIIPDPSLTLDDGAVDPWAGSWRSIYSRRLREFSKRTGLPLDVPWRRLKKSQQDQVMHGAEGLRGAIPFLERLQKKSYKAGNRFLVKRYQRPVRCRQCLGSRLRPEARSVRIDGVNIVAVSRLPVSETLPWLEKVADQLDGEARQQAAPILEELLSRLRYLDRVDLGYLTLDRLSRTLSGGEMQRIELANALGANLVDTLYVLDEPTVGLHPRDTDRLVAVLEDLTHRGNTLIVVEHDPLVIRRADWLVDLGPGAGEAGGELLYSGPPDRLGDTPTGRYLEGEFQVRRRRIEAAPCKWLELAGARLNNLRDVKLRVPIGRLTCVTGVSGSGKSSLIDDTLYPAVAHDLGFEPSREPGPHDALTGLGELDRVVLVDQTPIGKSPRSNPVTYIKAFAAIRDVFAAQPLAAERGYRAGTFSFNVEGGRCEACRGEGAVKVEMYFLADLFVPCEECGGTRFRREVLEVRFRGRNIHEALSLTVEEARQAFGGHPPVVDRLEILSRVGLGYLRLGQPATTLSGGESQRLKIARELSERAGASTLYLLDEPTVGLHASDVQVLLDVLSDLVERGGTVILVEHHLDVIRNADWVVDLGPGGGKEGGDLVAEGTPETIAATKESVTGRYLAADGLERRKRKRTTRRGSRSKK
jgi:excinuclease ABC subunit A